MRMMEEFFETARERHKIFLKRKAGVLPPWTEDPVFSTWSFCNVHRENDRVTRWFKENIREHVRARGIVAASAVLIFRWFNSITTGELLKHQLLSGRWSDVDFMAAHEILRNAPGPVFTGAYIVRSPFGVGKIEGILGCIYEALPMLETMVPSWGSSLQEAHADLCRIPFMGAFTSYEVVTDLRHTNVLGNAKDIMTWASAGPGCARGLGWVVDGDPGTFNYTSAAHQEQMLLTMRELLAMSLIPELWPYERWEMREVEHWACEFDKYRRAKAGERLKRRYTWKG